jgi:hypothetical protein
MNILIGLVGSLHHEKKKCMQNFSGEICWKAATKKGTNVPAIAGSGDVEKGQLCAF